MARAKRHSFAPEDVFVNALSHARPEFVQCREMAHRWKIVSPFRLIDTDVEDRQPRGGFREFVERKLQCQRCEMIRADAFSISTRHGHTALTKIGSSYSQPEGYAITGIGNTAGMRDLLYGVAFDAQQDRAETRRNRKAS